MRWIASLVGIGISLSTADVALGDAIRYNVTEISPLSGDVSSVATGIDNNGNVVGLSFDSKMNAREFLYRGGKSTDLGFGYWPPVISLGGAIAGSNDHSGFLVLSGSVTPIAAGVGITAVNDSGELVRNDFNVAEDKNHAYVFKNGVWTDIGVVAPSGARGINDSGQVVGAFMNDAGYQHPFLYDHGLRIDLGVLPNAPDGVATAINNRSEVVGGGTFPGSHAFLYNALGLHDLGTLGGPSSYAKAINDQGLVVGNSFQQDGTSQVFLYDGSRMLNLTSLLMPSSTWVLTSAYGINDSGEIVASGYNATDGFAGVVLLSPMVVPEPSTSFTVIAGIVFLALFRNVKANSR
jgi:probable HAF family extracellular repeat protein